MAFRKIKGSFKNRDISTHIIEDTYLAHDTVTGQLRIGDGVTPGGTIVSTGGSSSLTIQDEGSSLSTSATTINFVGDGVEVTGTGATKTVTISGSGGGSADLGELQISGSKLSVQDSSTVGVGIENIRIAGSSFTIDDSTDTGFEFTGHLVPSQDGVFDLGKAGKRWKTAFLSAETIDIGGATISSDGTGAISIASSGVTLPENSKVGQGVIVKGGTTAGTGARPIQEVKIFTSDGSSTLTDAQLLATTAPLSLEFNASIETVAVYTAAGQKFTLSDGNDLESQDTITVFQF